MFHIDMPLIHSSGTMEHYFLAGGGAGVAALNLIL